MFRKKTIPTPLRESSLSGRVPDSELITLDRIGTTVNVQEGQLLMRQDSMGREFLVILDGAVTVARDEQSIAELGSGDFVGESALLARRPRNASVVATEDASVIALNRREFASLLDLCPTLNRHIRVTAMKRNPQPA